MTSCTVYYALMSLLCKYCTVHYVYCTVHYSGTLCHYYVNTVQYITYSVNTVQYITVVHYLVHKYCAVLTSVDSNDILYNSMHDALTPGYLWQRRHHHPSGQAHCMTPSYLLFINQVTPGYINTASCDAQLFLMKKTKDGWRCQPGGRHSQQ